uniref:Uncharacterized protein n=1 Tax=Laticauda laticaudata TaxID=8630 RepID=A0A8C5RWP5_LATLA
DVAQQPKSQIPGLCDFEGPHHDITFGSRRKWMKDTDSEYVKLAKQGGQPDLLRHFTSPRKVSPYCAPESHHCKQAADNSKSHVPVMPDYMIHEEFNSDQPTSYKPKRGPFDFDMKSIWQRDAEDKENQKKKEVRPVNFSKLISNGYGGEWLQQRDQWEKKNTLPYLCVYSLTETISIFLKTHNHIPRVRASPFQTPTGNGPFEGLGNCCSKEVDEQ